MLLRLSIGAFPLSQETADAVEALKGDRAFLRSSFDIQQGGIDRAATYLLDRPTPPLLIVEVREHGEAMYEKLYRLANVCDPNTMVILIGVQNDIGIFRSLLHEGISDYLLAPVTSGQLRDSIADLFKGASTGETGRVIAFTGVSGGVGSSVVAHNTAYEIARKFEQSVIVVDLDIPYGTAGLNFNLQPRQTIVDALSQVNRLDEAFLEQFLMDVDDNISVLASPAMLGTGLELSAAALTAMMKHVKRLADFIILDVPHIWESWVAETLLYADELVIMARPDLINLRNAKNLVEFLGSKRGTDSLTRLVFNQTGAAKKTGLSEKDFKDAIAMVPSLSIPYDPEAFGTALNNGEMMSKASKKSKATQAIMELAKIVSGLEKTGENEKKSLLSFFKTEKKKKPSGR